MNPADPKSRSELNKLALSICRDVQQSADEYDVETLVYDNGSTVLDFGSDRLGTLAGGLALARICLADLASVNIVPSPVAELTVPFIQVTTDFPLDACIASQYAGWPFSTERLFSMCSGPARLKRGREEILSKFDLTSDEDIAVGVFESNRIPDEQDMAEFAAQCHCQPKNTTACVARTSSLPGTIQVVARSVETAMHKLFELDFDLSLVKRAVGTAPLPPIGRDDYQSMGWTNDSVLLCGDVVLWVDDVSDLSEFIEAVPSKSSDDFGKPFVETFEKYNRDFYQVDRLLFSPARITIVAILAGKMATAGTLRPDLLTSSFSRKP